MRFLANASFVASGTVISAALSLAIMPILARLYSPELIGKWGFFVGISGILSGFSCFRLDACVASQRYKSEAVYIACGATLVIATTGLVSLAMLFSMRCLGISSPWDTLGSQAYLIPLAASLISLAAVLTQVQSRNGNGITIGFAKLSTTGTQGISQVAIGLGGGIGWGMLIGDLLGRAVGNLVLLRRSFAELSLVLQRRGWTGCIVFAYGFRRVSAWLTASTAMNLLANHAPLLAIVMIFDSHTAGLYAISERIVSIPSATIGQGVSQMYLAHLSRSIRQSPSRALRNHNRLTYGLLGVGVIAGTALSVIGHFGIDRILGNQWSQVSSLLPPLSLGAALALSANPSSVALVATGHQKSNAAIDAMRLLAQITAIFIGAQGDIVFFCWSCCFGRCLVNIALIFHGSTAIREHPKPR